MPVRSTKRGVDRTAIGGEYDVVICGASFAGLAVARELTRTDARVLILDRYDVGERQTSACAAPTLWLERLGLTESIRQTFEELVIHTPHTSARYKLPWTFSTFDYRQLCGLLDDQNGAEFETAKVDGPAIGGEAGGPVTVRTDRGDVSARLVVDALGWRRVLAQDGYQPPDAPLSRGLEVHPHSSGKDLEIWIERDVVPAGYGWSFPADQELRVGVGSFDPRHHVKDPTIALAQRLDVDSVRFQGNWIPHKLREATAGPVFFAGDSAGHCLPLTAEGIRTALYFGIACGRELCDVIEGRTSRDAALQRYGDFSATHKRAFDWMLRVQNLVPKVPPHFLGPAINLMGSERFVRWSFNHYFEIAHPDFPRGGEPVAVFERDRELLPA